MRHVQGLRNLAVDGAGGNLSSFPQLLGVLGSAINKALGAEGLAVFQQTDLGHFVSQSVDVLALGLNAPLLGDADQLLRVLDLIVAALAGLVQGVHDFTAMVGVRCRAAGGEDQIVTGNDAVDVAATDAAGCLLGDTAGTHGADAAAGACFAEAAVRSLVLGALLPGVSTDLVGGFQQGVGSSFHLLDGCSKSPILQSDFLLILNHKKPHVSNIHTVSIIFY